MDSTLRVLDEIEGYRDSEGDLYTRAIVECRLTDGKTLKSFVYFFAAAVPDECRVKPNRHGVCVWPVEFD